MLVFLLIGERPPLRPPQHRCGDTSSRLAKRRNAVGSQTPTSVVLTAGTRTCRDDTTNCGPIVTMRGHTGSQVAPDPPTNPPPDPAPEAGGTPSWAPFPRAESGLASLGDCRRPKCDNSLRTDGKLADVGGFDPRGHRTDAASGQPGHRGARRTRKG